MGNVQKYCEFVGDVIDVYEETRDSKIRNDLYREIIVPALQIIYDRASRWEIDGEEVDLILDNHPGSSKEPDSFMEKITPEIAYEFLAAQRKHYEISSRFEYIVNHPVQPEEEDTSSPVYALKKHINEMKGKLDAASALLDISTRTRIDDLEFDPIIEKLSFIIRDIYQNIVPNDEPAEKPVETEPIAETVEENVPTPVVDLEVGEDSVDIASFVDERTMQ